MISTQTKDLLAQLGNTNYSKAIQEFLDEALDELNDVSTITSFDDALGRKRAIQTIEKLFTLMGAKTKEKKQKTQYI